VLAWNGWRLPPKIGTRLLSAFAWLQGDILVQMELFDYFGQRTTLKLTRYSRNPAIAPTRFTFSPPKGADIISD